MKIKELSVFSPSCRKSHVIVICFGNADPVAVVKAPYSAEIIRKMYKIQYEAIIKAFLKEFPGMENHYDGITLVDWEGDV